MNVDDLNTDVMWREVLRHGQPETHFSCRRYLRNVCGLNISLMNLYSVMVVLIQSCKNES